jgi:DNA replication and repair protein RecF
LEGRDALLSVLEANERREMKLERPLSGPHRDELEILWEGHSIRRVASAGERKALGLLLLAAQGRILEGAGKVPLYLLDDADTELDQTRLQALWTIFGKVDQLFATSNRPKIWRGLEGASRWSCEVGRVRLEVSP